MPEMTTPYDLRYRGLYDALFRNPHTFRQRLELTAGIFIAFRSLLMMITGD